MFLLASTAFALECQPGDAACEGANDLAIFINEAFDEPVISDSATQARFRTATIRDQLSELLETLDSGSCSVLLHMGVRAESKTFSGGLGVVGASTPVSGTFGRGVWEGGNPFADLGERTGFGEFERGQFVGDANLEGSSGFIAGHYARVQGGTHFAWGVAGICAGGNHAEVLDPWYPGDLSPFFQPAVTELTFFLSQADNDCADFGIDTQQVFELECTGARCVLKGEGDVQVPEIGGDVVFIEEQPDTDWIWEAPGTNDSGSLEANGNTIDLFLNMEGEQEVYNCSAYGFVFDDEP